MAIDTKVGTGVRGGSIALLVAGLLFVVYPVLRPYGDTVLLDGAPAFASAAWVVAHLSAVAGFVLLPLGLLALRTAIGGRLAGAAFVTMWIGIGMVLPYYGAETFALNAIGQRVLETGDTGLLALVDAIRFGSAQVTLFGVGLVLIAVAAVLAGVAVWRSGVLSRWSAVPFAAAFALFLPQFFGTPELRIAHGVLAGVGCVLLATQLRTARLWVG
ncbi:hypothetical protein [Pseudonocardia sp. TRM90224]|uniref:hypothetical protein n=1 Tax=Pseudonocardia sp. TRM90224 TaxID=2812678 RepID=UPI001E3159C5|nr:hypothetical protein [Pseudonocardia sp. TRM90224]